MKQKTKEKKGFPKAPPKARITNVLFCIKKKQKMHLPQNSGTP